MSKVFILALVKRFARSFVAGGLAALTLQLTNSPQPGFNNFVEAKVWIVSLVYAFLVGGVMALEKASRWQ